LRIPQQFLEEKGMGILIGLILLVVGGILGFASSPWWFLLAVVGIVVLVIALPASGSSGRSSSDGGFDFDFGSDD
jgi:membrane glycosyltransferase